MRGRKINKQSSYQSQRQDIYSKRYRTRNRQNRNEKQHIPRDEQNWLKTHAGKAEEPNKGAQA
jgi:hypothetical protein